MSQENLAQPTERRGDALLSPPPCYLWGWTILLLFTAQLVYGWQWSWLVALQENDAYRQLTGFVLGFLLLLQWRFSWRRKNPDRARVKIYSQRHKWQGVIGIAVFYLHSTTLGFAYQAWLSCAWLGNTVTGLATPEAIDYRKRWYVFTWLIVHVCLAVVATLLLFYHLYIVYTYH